MKYKYIYKYIIIILSIFCFSLSIKAQVTFSTDKNIDYKNPKEYVVGGVTISGVQFLDENVLKMIAGIKVGETIKVPGDKTTKAVKNLWSQGLFSKVSLRVVNIVENRIFLDINLEEKPRLSKFNFKGIKKSDADDIRKRLDISRGDVVNDNMLISSTNKINDFYAKKGFYNVDLNIIQTPDTSEVNSLILTFDIDKNKKVKIKKINIDGNQALDDQKIKMTFKETKEKGYFKTFSYLDTLFISTVKKAATLDFGEVLYNLYQYTANNTNIRLFKSSKFVEDKWEEDKQKLIEKYNSLGYRDFKILSDSVYFTPDKQNLFLDVSVSEGKKYYFRDITWVGNTKYSAEQLNNILKVKKGDVYNRKHMETNLNFNMNGMDVSSLYMDDGYLFFRVVPVEVLIENDSIDIQMQMIEGPQAYINKVKVLGNTKTNDFVAMREIRTRPGDLFSRSNIIRSTRELASLGYFNPETITPDIQQNSQDGTVDIIYKVEETSSDKLELSAGWGMRRVIGTVGIQFSNFSLRNIFNKEAWNPIPVGDGQTLQFRFQTFGKSYIALNTSFTEPWLGRKRPNAFTTSYTYQRQTPLNIAKSANNYGVFSQHGLIFGLGRRLEWPDDFFTLYQNISLIYYNSKNGYAGYYSFMDLGDGGDFYNISYGITLSRNSTDQPYYPRMGADISFSIKATPPYSLFNRKTAEEYAQMSSSQKNKWIEYHRWDFKASYYQRLIGDLVLMMRIKYGFLGCYNKDLGITSFERYYMGGDGLSAFAIPDGREIVGFRGYTTGSMSPDKGATIYNKNTVELRYPLSLNPSATIYALLFLESGYSWANFNVFTPFDVCRSAGVGVRVFMPMFGLLGIDWGYGFDDIPGKPGSSGSQFHFSINGSID